jgi:hypothetical protein
MKTDYFIVVLETMDRYPGSSETSLLSDKNGNTRLFMTEESALTVVNKHYEEEGYVLPITLDPAKWKRIRNTKS